MSLDSKIRILVVDDEASYRMSVAMVLKKSGLYEVDEAGSGEEAIGALKQFEYGLIILDHQMGEVSGLNVMQWFLEQKVQVPVIVLTGSGSDTIAAEMMKLGAYDYVRKDQLELARIPTLVGTTLEGYKSRQVRQQENIRLDRTLARPEVSDLLQKTGASFSRSTEAVIGLLAEEFGEYHKRVWPSLNESDRIEAERMMRNFTEQLKLVSLFTKTFADLALSAVSPQAPDADSGRNNHKTAGYVDNVEKPGMRSD